MFVILLFHVKCCPVAGLVQRHFDDPAVRSFDITVLDSHHGLIEFLRHWSHFSLREEDMAAALIIDGADGGDHCSCPAGPGFGKFIQPINKAVPFNGR